MNNLYKCVDYEQLKEGEMIIAFGTHVLRWDFDLMGIPSYGFVPAEEETCEWELVLTDEYDYEGNFDGEQLLVTTCNYELNEHTEDIFLKCATTEELGYYFDYKYCPNCGKKIVYKEHI